jgi:3-deoxy-D-manno-octulosonic-acid transferase
MLAASTHGSEEAVALEAYSVVEADARRPLLVIVPRHPARGPEVLQAALRQGGDADWPRLGPC